MEVTENNVEEVLPVEDAVTEVPRKPTTKEINEYRKTLKENTELLELEARNWKAQFEGLYYRAELGKLQQMFAQPVGDRPQTEPASN